MLKLKKSYTEIVLYVMMVIVFATIFFYEYAKIVNVLGSVIRALGPFIIGFSIAYILNRPLKWLEAKFRMPRPMAILSLYIGIGLIFGGFIYYYLPQVIQNGGAAIQALLEGFNDLSDWFRSSALLTPVMDYVSSDMGGLAQWATAFINQVMTQASSVLLDFTGILLNLFFGTIISLYMLFSKEKLKATMGKALSFIFKQRTEGLLAFLGEVNHIFSHFISGLIVEAFIVGILAYIILLSLGVRYSLVLALIILFMNVVPYLGPILSAIPAILTTLTYDPGKALWVALCLLLLQQLDGNYIGPKVMGNFIGMEPIWVIFSISIGAGLGGVVGILLAIPTAAIVKIVWSNLVNKTEN